MVKEISGPLVLDQVEICSNIIFKSSSFCTNLFERLVSKYHTIGLPDSISKIFERRPYRSQSKSTFRLYDNKVCIKHWFRRNSIKLYNKLGYYLRTETTINNPQSLGLKKRGRQAKRKDATTQELERLRRENRRLAERLRQAETIIEVQKKVSEIVGLTTPTSQSESNEEKH